MAGWRPTKYRPEMCNRVIELMKEWASLVEVAADLGICEDTLHEWKKTNKEFSESIKRWVQLSESWWQRVWRLNVHSNKDAPFDTTLWYMNMKNRFKWADRQEVDQKTELKFKPEDLKKMSDIELDELINKQ